MRFQPRGETPLWSRVYDAATAAGVGELLAYDDLTSLLGYDPSEPGAARAPIRKASDRLRRIGLTLVAERGAGYRVSELSSVAVPPSREVRQAAEAVSGVLAGQERRIAAIEDSLRAAGLMPTP